MFVVARPSAGGAALLSGPRRCAPAVLACFGRCSRGYTLTTKKCRRHSAPCSAIGSTSLARLWSVLLAWYGRWGAAAPCACVYSGRERLRLTKGACGEPRLSCQHTVHARDRAGGPTARILKAVEARTESAHQPADKHADLTQRHGLEKSCDGGISGPLAGSPSRRGDSSGSEGARSPALPKPSRPIRNNKDASNADHGAHDPPGNWGLRARGRRQRQIAAKRPVSA